MASARLASRHRDHRRRARQSSASIREILGLRLVKRTVNFDDPTAHHLYYGDETGAPGSILTFFAWEGAHAGRLGLGQAVEIAFRVPRQSLGWWTQRLIEQGIAFDAPEKRFGETVLGFKDPDGIRLEIVASAAWRRARRMEQWHDSRPSMPCAASTPSPCGSTRRPRPPRC